MEHIRSAIFGSIVRRQYCVVDEDGSFDEETCDVPFWYTKTGSIVKWSIFLGLTGLFTLYLILGYIHAKSRIKKGLPPLTYHRWLVSRRDLARVDPRYQYPPAGAYTYTYYDPNNPQQQQAYGMHAMPPPPVYDPNAPRPPVYDGPGINNNVPAGGTKVDPSQQPTRRPTVEDDVDVEAPPGPPPGATPAQNTGNTNPFRG